MSESVEENQPNDHFPPGARNSFYFQFFNTASFGTILGVPMILFFKEMGASVTVLGIVTSLAPLLMILQIPASRHVERTGYRRFVLNGWRIRTVFCAGMMLVALLPSTFDISTRMILAIFFLIGYNISRGISMCGFMPWISQLIPENVRGRFLATDQMTGSIAGLVSTIAVSAWLHFHSHLLGFAGVFFFATLMGYVSIRFLKRIPDIPVPHQSKSMEPVPWKELLSYAPFNKIVVMNVIVCAASAGSGLFWVPLLKDHLGKDSSFVLSFLAFCAALTIFVQYIAGTIIDRTGSKPALIFGTWMAITHFSSWSLVAAHILPLNLGSIVLLQGTAAMGFPLFNLATARLLMSAVPS
ncbi:MAG: MFS transporter, partial [Verrucomicrobiota bacterium]